MPPAAKRFRVFIALGAVAGAAALAWRAAPWLRDVKTSAPRVPAPTNAVRPKSPVGAESMPAGVFAWENSRPASTHRQRDMVTALHEWGASDLVAAIAWALDQDNATRALALEAALVGAAGVRPEFAAQAAKELLAADPSIGAAPATALIAALGKAERFDLASELAVGAPPSLAAELTETVFAAWGRTAPEDALAALSQFADAAARHSALVAIVGGWAASDPAALARRAWTSFTGDDRAVALHQAVASWANRDVNGLALWLDTLPPGRERDAGAAVAADHLAAQNPGAAFAWMEKISDADGRFRSLRRVAAGMDPSVARVYVAQMNAIPPTERSAVLRQLEYAP